MHVSFNSDYSALGTKTRGTTRSPSPDSPAVNGTGPKAGDSQALTKCNYCKKPLPESAVASHAQLCDKKKEINRKKKEAKQPKAKAKEAAEEKDKDGDSVMGESITAGQRDNEAGEGGSGSTKKPPKKSAFKASADGPKKSKKRKADGEGDKEPKKKKLKKDEPPKPKLPKPKGPGKRRAAMRRHASQRRFLRSLSNLQISQHGRQTFSPRPQPTVRSAAGNVPEAEPGEDSKGGIGGEGAPAGRWTAGRASR